MSATPAIPQLFGASTLGSMSARVTRWARERVDPDILADAVNDAIESLWMAAQLATLSKFTKGVVTQNMVSGATVTTLVSIADPQIPLTTATVAMGAAPARQLSLTYTLVTDSGSETLAAPAVVVAMPANVLCQVTPPLPDSNGEALGWNIYVRTGIGGTLGTGDQPQLMNVVPLPFNRVWTEPLVPPPQVGAQPPHANTTGDNIFGISRIDVTNQNGTKTTWNQADVASLLFTDAQKTVPFASTYQPQVFDLLGNSQIQVRPALALDVQLDMFLIFRPRRLQYPQSRIPFTSFPNQRYIFCKALSDVLDSLYEDKAAETWAEKAKTELDAITLSILGENWYKNNTVKPYLR